MRLGIVAALVVGGAVVAPTAIAQGTGTTPDTDGGTTVTRVGTRGANFLELGVGARSLALAGAVVATPSDLSALYWNVAGLGEVQTATGFISHEKLFGGSGLTNSYLAVALPLFGGALAASVQSFTSGDIVRTSEEFPDGNDPTGGRFTEWNATAIGLHYARLFTDRLSVGLTGKYATEGIDFASASYIAADVGVRFRTGLLGTTMGASITNLGTAGRIDGPAIDRKFPPTRDPLFPTGRTLEGQVTPTETQLPTMLRFGVHTEIIGATEALFPAIGGGMHRLSMLVDVSDGINTPVMPAIAAEYGFNNRVFLRLGRRFTEAEVPSAARETLSAGAGLAVPFGTRRVLVDYAYRTFGELNENHVFSFQFGN